MIPIVCPNDRTPLDRDWARDVYVCPQCRAPFVVSISDAYHTPVWNRHAPGAGAVEAVMARLNEKVNA